jgi:alpha-D-glucose phosphate-specific phosphoglucomutase
MMKEVSFGTDGWRGVMAEDFTVLNVRRVVQAILSYIKKNRRDLRVLVGYDNRFMSEYYAAAAAEVSCGNGARVLISPRPVTTPMLSLAVNAYGADGGIMVTASHNPYQYNGIKFKASYGGSAVPRICDGIEALIGKETPKTVPYYEDARRQGVVLETDFFGLYKDRLREMLDLEAIGGSGLKVGIDCMHGSAGQYIREVCDMAGVKCTLLRAGRDPLFGGMNPEPMEKNLSGLATEVKESDLDAGFAFDGDADRLGVLDGSGGYVTPHQVLALFLLHMAGRRKLRGMVVKTVSTSSIIDRIAGGLGLPVKETPVGFKHICELMIEGDVLIGGEENGGYGFKGYIPERDGMLAAMMLAEIMAVEGKPLKELLAGIDRKYGKLCYRRHDDPINGMRRAARMDEIAGRAGEVFGEFKVSEVRTSDGVKVIFKDGAWVLFRRSGTEPVMRIYSEADDPVKLDRLITRGREAFIG